MESGNILDKIMGSQTQNSLNEFEPVALVLNLLTILKERDREILSSRFGLDHHQMETLEAIGLRHSLTRERVRQIEKDSLTQLRKKNIPELNSALQILFETILEHGSIMSADQLIQTVIYGKSDDESRRAIEFLLNIGDQFENLKESPQYYNSWHIAGFDMSRLSDVLMFMKGILETEKQVMSHDLLLSKFKLTDYFMQREIELTDRVLKNYLNTAKSIQINPFNEIGLKHWTDVKPRDVGDKAYLVLKHHGKPEHYSLITKMINVSNFDTRTAYQETVHNELIKDNRFVLVGRGIYALSDWGYKKGVVADVIKEIMNASSRPLTRNEIISEVLKKRQVKRNTILVGLSNRKHFQKVGKDKYIPAG